jgi:hypothetical protein
LSIDEWQVSELFSIFRIFSNLKLNFEDVATISESAVRDNGLELADQFQLIIAVLTPHSRTHPCTILVRVCVISNLVI